MRFGSFFFGTIVIGAMVGWFAPNVSQPAPADAGEEAVPDDDRLEVVRQEQSPAGEVVLPRSGDGHFYADVSSDNGTVTMLVDTGASVIALTGDDAAAMGADWHENDVRPVA